MVEEDALLRLPMCVVLHVESAFSQWTSFSQKLFHLSSKLRNFHSLTASEVSDAVAQIYDITKGQFEHRIVLVQTRMMELLATLDHLQHFVGDAKVDQLVLHVNFSCSGSNFLPPLYLSLSFSPCSLSPLSPPLTPPPHHLF